MICRIIKHERDEIVISVRYGAGRGGYSPRPLPIWGESPLIPWTVPCILPPIFNGGPAGEWLGQGVPKKDAPPQAVQRGEAGNGAGGPPFWGPRRPCNER